MQDNSVTTNEEHQRNSAGNVWTLINKKLIVRLTKPRKYMEKKLKTRELITHSLFERPT